MQYGKDDERLGLHVAPRTYTTSGLQLTDFLGLLGFSRSPCVFVGPECYVREAPDELDVRALATALPEAFDLTDRADSKLQGCGLLLPRNEGFGFFYHRPSSGERDRSSGGGDGHTGLKVEQMKRSEDGTFEYSFTWRHADHEKGWVIHIHPKHPPASSDLLAAFGMLGLHQFTECPEFDFQPCWWHYFDRPEDADHRPGFFVNERAHGAFGAMATNLTPGLRDLVIAHERLIPFGLRLLPEPPRERGAPARTSVTASTKTLPPRRAASDPRFAFDVAVSYAGPQKSLAESIATAVRSAGFEVFFDAFYPEQLWGRDLTVFFDKIYRKDSRFCLMLLSGEYVERIWTTRERQSAMARMVEERGEDYVLPVKVEDVEVPGLPPTIGYLSLQDRSIEQVAELLVKKLRG